MGELCKVLIVDDELLVRQGIKNFLDWEREGFQIVGEASNGQEALKYIEALKPHIVITDIVMPVMDGEEFTRIVKTRYPEIEVIVLSSFGEYEYVRSTFRSGVTDYILKPKLEVEEMLEVLKNAARRVPGLHFTGSSGAGKPSVEQYMEKLISGYEVNFDSKFIDQALPHSCFFLMGADLNRIPGRSESFVQALKDKMTAELKSRFDQLIFYPVKGAEDAVVYLLNLEEKELGKVSRFAKTLSASTADRYPDICWLVSGKFHRFAEVGQVYKEHILKLSQYRFYFPDRHVLIYDELPEPLPAEKFNLKLFTDEMKRRRFESAFRYLMDHVRSLTGDYRTGVFEFKTFLENLIFNITILLSNMDFEIKELEEVRYSYFRSIDEARSAEQAVKLMSDFIREVNQCIYSLSNRQRFHPRMEKLLEYIHDRYSEPLTLKDVADHFHFHPSYLSSCFSAYMKEGFSDYLNRIRIEKAEELLCRDSASISEISAMVGYSDHSYFCKVFKKYTGMSPSEYRKKQLNQKRETK